MKKERCKDKGRKKREISHKKEEETNTLQGEEKHIKGSLHQRVIDSSVARDQAVTRSQGEHRITHFLVEYFVGIFSQNCHNVSKLLFPCDPIVYIVLCCNGFNNINSKNGERLS